MKGILFKPDMVKAIVEGRKTVTRRLITKHSASIGEGGDWNKLDFYGEYHYRDYPNQKVKAYADTGFPNQQGKYNYGYLHVPYNFKDQEVIYRVYPRLEPGDVVYIKEAWRVENVDTRTLNTCNLLVKAGYKTDSMNVWGNLPSTTHFTIPDKWHSPMMIPATLARYFIQITDVRPERLQEITEEDAFLEGMSQEIATHLGYSMENYTKDGGSYYRHIYKILWDSINPKHPWASNPFIWRIEFSKVEKP